MPVTCVVCGGTDFHKEAGFYFCKDCETQTQDIQEHVFEDQIDDADKPPQRTTKKKPKPSTKAKNEERLTSWECYNYILLGLVNELIELGADESLKTTVEVLWFHYLKNIEVIREGNLPPKLPAVNSERDASIIYGRTKSVKRRRSRSRSVGSTTDLSTLDKESIRRERTKQKRALARTEYDFLSSTQQSDTSLANQSLSSLKSPGSSNVDSKIIQYNKSAETYLKKHMKNSHLKRHCEDVHLILDCHQKFTRRSVGTYYVHPSLLSRSKLFSILYLGLIINKDKIQLGDVLRFIKEGHLSFQHVDHFFPEECIEKKLNGCSFTMGPSFMSHSTMRTSTAKMIEFLGVKKYVPVQNIVEICERYCKELNLPDSIYDFTLNIISRTLPKFPLSSTTLPNYEGRTISFIIFILKLLFGLDDETEYEMSKLSSIINPNLNESDQKMFDFNKWLTFIQYRHFILTQYNFPTSYNENSLEETKIFIKHLDKYHEKSDLVKESDEIEIFKRLLNKLDGIWEDFNNDINYNPSLTPYKDYISTLLNKDKNERLYNENLLRFDFRNNSLEYLFYSELYLNKIYPNTLGNVIYKSGGKNNNVQFIYLFDFYKKYREKLKYKKDLINVTLLNDSLRKFHFYSNNNCNNDIKPNSKSLLEDFNRITFNKIKRNSRRRKKLFENHKISLDNIEKVDIYRDDYVLYEPSERFCGNLQNVSLYTEEEWEKFFKTFSLSFRIILKECARITEQTMKDVYLEYLKVEIYLTHVLDVGKDRFYKEKIVNNELKKNIEFTIKNW